MVKTIFILLPSLCSHGRPRLNHLAKIQFLVFHTNQGFQCAAQFHQLIGFFIVVMLDVFYIKGIHGYIAFGCHSSEADIESTVSDFACEPVQ